MKTFKIAATIVAASIAAFTIASASAQDGAASPTQGHYEWRAAPQHGPRAPSQAPMHGWVPDAMRIASRNCGTMKMRGADATSCMKDMTDMASPSGASAS